VEEVASHFWGETPEMSEKLRWLAVAHLLERKKLANVLLSPEGEPPHQLGPHGGVKVSLRQRCDDILYFQCVPVVQLRDHIVELCFLTADVGQGKLCLSLGKPHSWSLGPEWRKPHGHSGYFRWY
jgi:hypothetical protein